MNKSRSRKFLGSHEYSPGRPEIADRPLLESAATLTTRRGFVVGAGLAAMSGVLGSAVSFVRSASADVLPPTLPDCAGQLHVPDGLGAFGKTGLRVLNERPLNAETPAHLLDDEVTPTERLFVRNNGVPPRTEGIDPLDWEVEIAGESCLRPTRLTLRELRRRFQQHTLRLQLECGGNGRAEFHPPARGNQWTTGAVGCPSWTGVRLKDVLDYFGVAPNAVYVAYEAADTHLSGDPTKQAISRGVPLHKALEDESLLAWAVNGQPLPPVHGYPLRLVCAGWPGSVSGKWVTRILIRDRVHDGAKMGGQSYRVPCEPVAPGAAVADHNMCIIESMPVKSLITHPQSGAHLPIGHEIAVRGHAWAGDLRVDRLFTSIDFGATWQPADLSEPPNRLAWQRWSTRIDVPQKGYYEVWARAVDELGRSQPLVLPSWNPRGYLNNACHRIAVQVV